MENVLFDLLDLTPAARYRHNRTGVLYTLTDVREVALMVYRADLTDDAGRVFQVPPPVLDSLYSIVETEDPEPVGILPIGSVSLDAADPPPGSGQDDDGNELIFRRPGRPSNSPREFDSYFGQPRKHGPRKK